MKELNERLNKLAENLKWHNVGYAQDVLAALESLRGLEQRAEAAERAHSRESLQHIDSLESLRDWKKRAEVAEAALAELEQQSRVGTVLIDYMPGRVVYQLNLEKQVNHGQPVYDRPAPAINLAELVPEKWTLKEALKFVEAYTPPSEEESVLFAVNSFRAATLRNIEEQSQ